MPEREGNFREEGLRPNRNFAILRSFEFRDDLVQEASKATQRVWIRTMAFEADEDFALVESGLTNAAQQGLSSRFYVDSFALLTTQGRLDYIPSLTPRQNRYRRTQTQAKRRTLDELRESNVDVVVTNEPNVVQKVLPYRGRNHIKMAIVDNVAWVGGINMTRNGFEMEDFMMRIEDPNIVNVLAAQFAKVNEQRPLGNYEIPCTDDTSILVDAGIKGKSLILDRAVKLIDQASGSVRLTSQYTPDGATLHACSEASGRAGTTVQVLMSDLQEIDHILPNIFERKNRIVSRIKSKGDIDFMEFPNWLHAKLLLIDSELPGRAVGMIGSHNFMTSGVRFGTEEIAIQSSNPQFISNLSAYYDSLLRQASGYK